MNLRDSLGNELELNDVVYHRHNDTYARIHTFYRDVHAREYIRFAEYINDYGDVEMKDPTQTAWHNINFRLATNKEVAEFERKLKEHTSG